jgi:hypothetical protein
MGVLISLIIILVALGTVAGVMYAVIKEKHEHEEWFIPPDDADPVAPPVPASTSADIPAEEKAPAQSENA